MPAKHRKLVRSETGGRSDLDEFVLDRGVGGAGEGELHVVHAEPALPAQELSVQHTEHSGNTQHTTQFRRQFCAQHWDLLVSQGGGRKTEE